jgi:hypothetical protein
MGKWQFWVDRGGTFTDVVGRSPEGKLSPPSFCPRTRPITPTPPSRGSPPQGWLGRPIESVKMGTTVATNALLERKGARVLLLMTEGFGDLLRIGTQARPRLFDLRSGCRNCSTNRSPKSPDASTPTARRSRRLTKRPYGRRCNAPMPTASAPSPSPSCIPTSTRRMRLARPRSRGSRLRADLAQPRGQPPHQAGRARRHGGGRCLSLSDPAPLRAPGGRCARSRRRAAATGSISCNRTAG